MQITEKIQLTSLKCKLHFKPARLPGCSTAAPATASGLPGAGSTQRLVPLPRCFGMGAGAVTVEGTGCHGWAVLEEPGGHSTSERGAEQSAASPHSTFPSPTASL